jgi:hypothetical protein
VQASVCHQILGKSSPSKLYLQYRSYDLKTDTVNAVAAGNAE